MTSITPQAFEVTPLASLQSLFASLPYTLKNLPANGNYAS